jgi:uncharacterized protein YgbK (DUF1537 family)
VTEGAPHPHRAALSLRDVLVIADDLTGAAEAAAAVAGSSGSSCRLVLDVEHDRIDDSDALVIDTNTRYAPSQLARRRLRAALDRRPGASVVFLKVDSLLRGRIAEAIHELRFSGRSCIVSTALPHHRRHVVDGLLLVDGVPLHETSAWDAEESDAPRSMAALVDTPLARAVTLAEVRSGELVSVLRGHLEEGLVPVCDGELPSDLEAVAVAAVELASTFSLALVGSGGLADAVGAVVAPPVGSPVSHAQPVGSRILFAIGTQAASARDQVDRLAASGLESFVLSEPELDHPDEAAHRIRAGLQHRDVVVSMTATMIAHEDVARRFARCIQAAVGGLDPVLVLVGGETARGILDALGERVLLPQAAIHPGTVLSHTARGTSVVTRPGSFGHPDHLIEIHSLLTP